MWIVAIALPILIVVFVLLLLAEVRRFKAGRHLISPRRLGLRLIAGGLMIVLLTAVFLGLFVLDLNEVRGRPHLFLVFWSACLGVSVLVILVMLADMREVEDRYAQRRHELSRDFARSAAKAEEPPARQAEARGDDEARHDGGG